MIENKKTIDFAFSLLRDGKTKEGVELLYKDHYARMYSIAFSVLKNEHDSRDVVHNVIAKLLSTAPHTFPNANESSWLYVVVKNAAVDMIKSNKTFVSLDDPPIIDLGREDEEIQSMIDFDEYQKMISKLDIKRQEIVTLKVIGGFTHREIAEMLGERTGMVQWLYATAIAKLKVIVPIMTFISTVLGLETVRRLLAMAGGSTDGSVDKPSDSYPGDSLSADVINEYILVIILICLAAFCVGVIFWMLFGKNNAIKKRKKKHDFQ